MQFKINWKKISQWLIDQLKGAAVKAALIKFLGSSLAGGFKAWLIKFIVTELFEEIAEPIMKAGVVQAGYIYNRVEGKILIKRVENAQDQNEHDTAMDDIFK